MARPLRSTTMTLARPGATLTIRIGGCAADMLEATTEDIRTAAHLMGAILLQAPMRRLEVAKAVSIAYLADRLSVINSGHPVSESTFRNERCGPVNALVQGHATGLSRHASWSDILTTAGGFISLRGDVTCDDLDELSVASWDAVTAAWQAAGRMSDADVRAIMQRLPESRLRLGADITEAMLAASGVRDPRRHLAETADHRWLNRLIARAATIGNDTLDRAV